MIYMSIKNDILSKHIIPQPLIINNDNKYELNTEYSNSLFATSDLNGYINTKNISNHYNNSNNQTNTILDILEENYYIPTIGELGIAFQNITKINQNNNENYLDRNHSKIFLSSTLENIQGNSFWLYDNKYGNILPYSEFISNEQNSELNLYSLLFKTFDNDTLVEKNNKTIINDDENVNYISNLHEDNIEVLSYMYYTNFNSSNLETVTNSTQNKYYFMQYRMAYSYSIEESEPLFSYWLYGDNTINDSSLNNMSYIYDQYELKWNNKNKEFNYNNNIHNNFFDVKNPPNNTYIFPISYNINNINNQQKVTININPYNNYYQWDNNTYFDLYGFKFYFILPFEYIFNKIREIIKNKYSKSNNIHVNNGYDLREYLRNHYQHNNNGCKDTNYYLNLSNNSNIYVKSNNWTNITFNLQTYIVRDGYGYSISDPNTRFYEPGKAPQEIFDIENFRFCYPYRIEELFLFTFFTKDEIENLNINFNLENFKISQVNKYENNSSGRRYCYRLYRKSTGKYIKEVCTEYAGNVDGYTQSIQIKYEHGAHIRNYIRNHYLTNLTSNQYKNLGINEPIVNSMERFLDLFGSLFYKYENLNDENYNPNYHEYKYKYINMFSYLDIFKKYNNSGYKSRYISNEGTNLNIPYIDDKRKRYYNISPIHYIKNNDERKIGYEFSQILTLKMQFNYKDNSKIVNYFALYYYTKDALIFICKLSNNNKNRSIQNLESVTFSLFFGSNNSDYTNVIDNFTIIPSMTFNLQFNTKNIYNLFLNNTLAIKNILKFDVNNENYLIEKITDNNIDNTDNNFYKINANNYTYYSNVQNIDINSYLSQFSNLNYLLINWQSNHHAITPKISTSAKYNYIKERISDLSNYYSITKNNAPINHKLCISANSNTRITYIDISDINKPFQDNNDYASSSNDYFYHTYFIDHLLSNNIFINNSYFAKEFINLPDNIINKYSKMIELESNSYSILRIWGHRNLNNIYDDYTIYKPTIINKNNQYHINIPSIGYKSILYTYHEDNKELINYLLSDYIIIINKTNNKCQIQFEDIYKLSILSDSNNFNFIINPFEVKILYPAVYNFNYKININSITKLNTTEISEDIHVFNYNLFNIIDKLKKDEDIIRSFDKEDIIYLILKKIILLINPDLNKISNYNNILSKLNNMSFIDNLINQIILYEEQNIENNEEISNESDQIIELEIKHCQNPFKGNIIFIN